MEDQQGNPVAREFRVIDLARMARKYVLITVPTGKVRTVDRMVGHTQHFDGPELIAALGAAGCWPIMVRRWGFPFHSLYRIAISAQADRVYDSFAGGGSYGIGRRAVSEMLTGLFYANDLFRTGDELIVLARAPEAAPASPGA